MKTRTGFVSNSSSSSFIVYGYSVDSVTQAFEFVEQLAPELITEDLRHRHAQEDLYMEDFESIFSDHPQLRNVFNSIVVDETIAFGMLITGIEEEYGANVMNVDQVASVLNAVNIKPEVIYGNYDC